MTPCQALIDPTKFHTVSFTVGGECGRHQARFPVVAMTLDVHIDLRDDISGMSFDWCINKSVYIDVTATTERRARSLVKSLLSGDQKPHDILLMAPMWIRKIDPWTGQETTIELGAN